MKRLFLLFIVCLSSLGIQAQTFVVSDVVMDRNWWGLTEAQQRARKSQALGEEVTIKEFDKELKLIDWEGTPTLLQRKSDTVFENKENGLLEQLRINVLLGYYRSAEFFLYDISDGKKKQVLKWSLKRK